VDEQLLFLLNDLSRASRPVELAARFFSSPLTGFGMLFVFAGLLCWRLRPAWLVLVALAVTVAASDALCYRVLKPLIERSRPCYSYADLFTPVGCGGQWSMPSNHAANAFAAAALVIFMFPRAAPAALLLAAAVGLSRVLVGVHYPSDVAVGAMVGALIGVGVGLVVWRRVQKR